MLCDDQEGWDGGRGDRRKGEGVRIIMADSHCCMAETNTVKINKQIKEKIWAKHDKGSTA